MGASTSIFSAANESRFPQNGFKDGSHRRVDDVVTHPLDFISGRVKQAKSPLISKQKRQALRLLTVSKENLRRIIFSRLSFVFCYLFQPVRANATD